MNEIETRALLTDLDNHRQKLTTTRNIYDLYRFLHQFETTKVLSLEFLSVAIKFAKLDWGENISFEITKDFLIIKDGDKNRKEIIGLSNDGLHLCSTKIPYDKMRTLFFKMNQTLNKYQDIYESEAKCH